MLQFNNTKAHKRKQIKSMFSLYPWIRLLNVAVSYCVQFNYLFVFFLHVVFYFIFRRVCLSFHSWDVLCVLAGLRIFPMFGGQNNLCSQPCIISELKLMVSFEPMDFPRYQKCNGKLMNWSRQRETWSDTHWPFSVSWFNK